MKQIIVRTRSNFEMVDITANVRAALKENQITNGLCYVFVPHTTAAVTINENADPDVVKDIIKTLDKLVPLNDHYRHMEGNAAAHVKASLIGSSQVIFIENGDLVLGTWQSIFFCEFDGPRTRKVIIKFITTAA